MRFPALQSAYFSGMPASGISLKDNCSYPLCYLLEKENTPASVAHAKPISPKVISCCMSSLAIEARFPMELWPLFQMFLSPNSSIITSCFLCPFHLARDDLHWCALRKSERSSLSDLLGRNDWSQFGSQRNCHREKMVLSIGVFINDNSITAFSCVVPFCFVCIMH